MIPQLSDQHRQRAPVAAPLDGSRPAGAAGAGSRPTFVQALVLPGVHGGMGARIDSPTAATAWPSVLTASGLGGAGAQQWLSWSRDMPGSPSRSGTGSQLTGASGVAVALAQPGLSPLGWPSAGAIALGLMPPSAVAAGRL
jgi:hypothetical protein